MTIAFIPVTGKLLTFGLTWVSITQLKKESKERTALFRSAQTEYYVRYSGTEIKYGLAKRIKDEIEDQPNGAVLSAAMLFSEYIRAHGKQENSVLVMGVDDNKAAMIALLKGEPYLDIVVPLGELESHLTSLAQEGHAAFVHYGDLSPYVQNIISAHDLLSEKTKLAALVRFTDPLKKLQRIAIGVAVIGIIGGGTTWKIIDQKQREVATTKNAIDPVQLYTENSQHLLATANFNGEMAHHTIWQAIKDRPIDAVGWSMKHIQCTANQCKELWKQQQGSFATLSQLTQSPQAITLQPNGDTSVITYPLAGQRTSLEKSSLPHKDALWIDLVTQQQQFKRMDANWVMTLKPAEIRGLTPSIMVGQIPTHLRVYSGEVTIRAPLGLGAEILQKHLKHVMVSEVVLGGFDNIKTATIQLKGTYYAQH